MVSSAGKRAGASGRWALLLALFPGPARAEHVAHHPQTTDTILSTAGQTPGPLKLSLESRPSWLPDEKRVFGFDNVEIGVRLSPTLYLGYQQQFFQNLISPPTRALPPLQWFDGFIDFSSNDLWMSDDKRWSFGNEVRVYLPTDPDKASAGNLLAVRDYLTLKRTISPSVSLLFQEVPIPQVYRHRGVIHDPTLEPALGAQANPAFENMVIVTANWTPAGSGWALSFPVYLDSTRYFTFLPDAKNSGLWTQWLFVYPEITYTFTGAWTVGAAYQSGNLLNVVSGLSDGDPSGVGPGIPRLIFRVGF